MEGIFKRLRNSFSTKKVCVAGPPKSVKIAIIGRRNVKGAHILNNFFKGTPEGQNTLTSLHLSQRAKLIVNLVDRDGSRPFFEHAVSESEVFLIVQEKMDKNEKLTELIKEIQERREGYPCQIFTVFNPKYHQSLTEVYPVLEGVQYSLCQYYQNIKVNAISPDYSITQHFLQDFCYEQNV